MLWERIDRGNDLEGSSHSVACCSSFLVRSQSRVTKIVGSLIGYAVACITFLRSKPSWMFTILLEVEGLYITSKHLMLSSPTTFDNFPHISPIHDTDPGRWPAQGCTSRRPWGVHTAAQPPGSSGIWPPSTCSGKIFCTFNVWWVVIYFKFYNKCF